MEKSRKLIVGLLTLCIIITSAGCKGNETISDIAANNTVSLPENPESSLNSSEDYITDTEVINSFENTKKNKTDLSNAADTDVDENSTDAGIKESDTNIEAVKNEDGEDEENKDLSTTTGKTTESEQTDTVVDDIVLEQTDNNNSKSEIEEIDKAEKKTESEQTDNNDRNKVTDGIATENITKTVIEVKKNTDYEYEILQTSDGQKEIRIVKFLRQLDGPYSSSNYDWEYWDDEADVDDADSRVRYYEYIKNEWYDEYYDLFYNESVDYTEVDDEWEEYIYGYWYYENKHSYDKIRIPNQINGINVTEIGEYAFANSRISEVEIPDTVVSIGKGAFCNCRFLYSVKLPENLRYIDDYTFNYCTRLQNINIPTMLCGVSNNAFAWCSTDFFPARLYVQETDSSGIDATNVYSDSDSKIDVIIDENQKTLEILYNSKEEDNGIGGIISDFAFCETEIENVVIDEGISKISDGAFEYCENLRSISLPETVTYIGDYAFCGCKNLESINIPDSVTYIGIDAFAGCESLTEIVLPGSMTEISEGTFWGCTGLRTVTRPESLHKIGKYAFCGCSSLEDIGSSSITGNRASFKNCSSLKNVYIQAYCIYDSCFYCCTSLANVVIAENEEKACEIEKRAFYGCASLTDIIIPKNCIFLGDEAFYGCTKLKNIMLPAYIIFEYNDVFGNCPDIESVTAVMGIFDYDYLDDWYWDLGTVEDLDGYIDIFKHCDKLTEITYCGEIIKIK